MGDNWMKDMGFDYVVPEDFEYPGCSSGLVVRDLEVDVAERGRMVVTLPVGDHIMNWFLTLHGGATASLIIIVGTAAIKTIVGPRREISSLDVNISYISSATHNEMMEVEAKVLRLGRKLAVTTIDLRNKCTKALVAQGRLTSVLGPETLSPSSSASHLRPGPIHTSPAKL